MTEFEKIELIRYYDRNIRDLDRFLKYIDGGMPYQCWEWYGQLRNHYGTFWDGIKHAQAHRWIYEYLFGSIPQGLDCHHICENKLCANPFHIKLVTRKEHSVVLSPNNPTYKNSRKTHCPKGHEYSQENTHIRNGSRYCKACDRISSIDRYYKNRERILAKLNEKRKTLKGRLYDFT